MGKGRTDKKRIHILCSAPWLPPSSGTARAKLTTAPKTFWSNLCLFMLHQKNKINQTPKTPVCFKVLDFAKWTPLFPPWQLSGASPLCSLLKAKLLPMAGPECYLQPQPAEPGDYFSLKAGTWCLNVIIRPWWEVKSPAKSSAVCNSPQQLPRTCCNFRGENQWQQLLVASGKPESHH